MQEFLLLFGRVGIRVFDVREVIVRRELTRSWDLSRQRRRGQMHLSRRQSRCVGKLTTIELTMIGITLDLPRLLISRFALVTVSRRRKVLLMILLVPRSNLYGTTLGSSTT